MRKLTTAAAVTVGRKLSIIEAINHPGLFAPFGFAGESWSNWRVILKGAFALAMDDAEREVFRLLAGVIRRGSASRNCGSSAVGGAARTVLPR